MVSRPDVSLSVGVKDRTRGGLDKVERAFSKSGGKISGSMGKAFSAIGGSAQLAFAAAGAAVVGFADKTLSEADRIGKLSTQSGLGVEAIQRLGHAAELGGTNVETLVKAQGRLTRVISDAGNGLATAQRSVAQLGLDYKALAAASPEQQFHMVADALTEIEDKSKRSALAQELFGRAGRDTLSVIGDEPGALRDISESLDNVWNEEQIRAAEEFNDRWTEIWGEAKGTFGGFVLTLADGFNEMVEDIGTIGGKVTDGVSGIWNFLTEPFKGDKKPNLVVITEEIGESIQSAYDKYNAYVGDAYVVYEEEQERYRAALAELAGGINAELGEINEAWKAHGDAVGAQVKRAGDLIAGYRLRLRGEADGIAAIIAEINELQGPIRDFGSLPNYAKERADRNRQTEGPFLPGSTDELLQQSRHYNTGNVQTQSYGLTNPANRGSGVTVNVNLDGATLYNQQDTERLIVETVNEAAKGKQLVFS